MNIYEFRDCIKYVFDEENFNGEIYKVEKNVFVIFYDGKAVVKSDEPMMNKSSVKDYRYTNYYINKENLLDCLIWIKQNLLLKEPKHTKEEIIDIINNSDYKYNINSIFKEKLAYFDKMVDPFNPNNDLYDFRLNDIIGLESLSVKLNFEDKNNFETEIINYENNNVLSYLKRNNDYSAKIITINNDGNKVFLEHLYSQYQKDTLLFMVVIDNFKFKINFDLKNNVLYAANNDKKEILPIHFELLIEDIDNINNILQSESNKLKKRVM